MTVVYPTTEVEIDWAGGDGFGGLYDDISEYVLSADWQMGRDYASELTGRAVAGSALIKVTNLAGFFSSFHQYSPIFGNILPGRHVRITTTWEAVKRVQWHGFLDSIVPESHLAGAHTATIRAVGPLGYIADKKCSVAMQTEITTGAAIELVLDAIGWPAGSRLIDAGQTTMARWWVREGTGALEALRELEATECGFLRESKDGYIIFEDRLHRLAAPHTVSQAEYSTEVGTTPIRFYSIRQEDPLRQIYNSVTANVKSYNISETVDLWTLVDVANDIGGAPPDIEAAATLTVWGIYPTPGAPAHYPGVNEWGTVNVTANDAADNSGASRLSDLTITTAKYADKISIAITNNGATTLYITRLSVDGTAVVEGDTAQVKAIDQDSIDMYGERSYAYPAQWISNLKEAKYFCEHWVAAYKQPHPILTIGVHANDGELNLEEALLRDVSDRITVAAQDPTGLYLYGDFFVERIAHSIGKDRMHTFELQCGAVSTHEWVACDFPRDPRVVPTPGAQVPDDLVTDAMADGLRISCNCVANKWNKGINEGEFRAMYFLDGQSQVSVDLRTVSEGGTLVHNGNTMISVTALAASELGCAYSFTSLAAGRWFYAFRLHNAVGWSVWSDGNSTPRHVIDYIDTNIVPAAGPPEDWDVAVLPDIRDHRVVVRASRPATNGENILAFLVQIRDGSQGEWYAIDAGAGQAATYYDGSGIDHDLDRNNTRIKRAAGFGFGTAQPGHVCLLDVRGGAFDAHHCQWGQIKSFENDDPTTAEYFDIIAGGRWRPQVTGGLRIKIVKPLWSWHWDGYLGDEANAGLWFKTYWQQYGLSGDTKTDTFISDPIEVPEGLDVANVVARVFFENPYSRSDDDMYSGAASPNPGCILLPIVAGSPNTVATNALLGTTFAIDATDNFTLSNPTRLIYCGQPIVWTIKQDTTGSRVMTLDTKFRVCSEIGTVTLSTAANARDYLGGIYSLADDKFDIVAFVTGVT